MDQVIEQFTGKSVCRTDFTEHLGGREKCEKVWDVLLLESSIRNVWMFKTFLSHFLASSIVAK